MAVLNSKSMLSAILEDWGVKGTRVYYSSLLELLGGEAEGILEIAPDETIAELVTSGDYSGGVARVKLFLANSIGAQQAFIGYLLPSYLTPDLEASVSDHYYLIAYPNEHAKNLLVLHIDPETMVGELLPYQNLTTLELWTMAQYWYQHGLIGE